MRLTLIIVVVFSILGGPIKAVEAAKYASSKSPFYAVGQLDKKLSRACQKGNFGQIKSHAYGIAFIGPKGRALTGIATSQWNLFDPLGLSQPKMTYHFYHQGFSDCRVYVAKQPPRQQ